ncbi:MAG TPA: phosphatase PAP2-related protein, partial [Anaeromyxobacteraceae bacterium]|nr:phosphatase PAP2-related protein [Anaeromyxobacteraceae bacterium]
ALPEGGMTGPMREAWSEAWRDRRFRRRAVVTAAALALALSALSRFVGWVEQRPGATLPDPLLRLLEPRDVTWLTFSLIYAGLLAGVALLLRRPRDLLAAVQAYAVMAVFRLAVMWATPLDPPPGMIALVDPFVQAFGTGQVLTRDLFFSGHTSTMFLLFLAAPGRLARGLFLACTALVAACVLWQHVHYAVDVMVAPPFAYAAWRVAARLRPASA